MENYRKLGARMQRFAEAIAEGCTAAEAVRRIRPKSGCPKQQGYTWRRIPRVAAAIDELRELAIDEAGVNLARVLTETARVAFLNLQDLFTEEGNLLPIDQWPEGAARAVVGIDFEDLFEGRGEDRSRIGQVIKIKAAPKVDALKLLGQYLKAWTDKHEVAGAAGAALIPAGAFTISFEDGAPGVPPAEGGSD